MGQAEDSARAQKFQSPGHYTAKDREKIAAETPEDFAGPHQSFPIKTQQDVHDAAKLIGHAADPAAVKAKIIAIAKRKGFSLPASWEAEGKERGDMPDETRKTDEIVRVTLPSEVRVINEERREFEICATSEAVDAHGTVFGYDASKGAFQRWIHGNIREMHERKAVGKRIDVRFDDDARKIYVHGRISKGANDTWEKLKDGTLQGASIGASNVKWENRVVADRTVPWAKDYDLIELSLVDAPSNPDGLGVTFLRAASMDPDGKLDEIEEPRAMADDDEDENEKAEENPVEGSAAEEAAETPAEEATEQAAIKMKGTKDKKMAKRADEVEDQAETSETPEEPAAEAVVAERAETQEMTDAPILDPVGAISAAATRIAASMGVGMGPVTALPIYRGGLPNAMQPSAPPAPPTSPAPPAIPPAPSIAAMLQRNGVLDPTGEIAREAQRRHDEAAARAAGDQAAAAALPLGELEDPRTHIQRLAAARNVAEAEVRRLHSERDQQALATAQAQVQAETERVAAAQAAQVAAEAEAQRAAEAAQAAVEPAAEAEEQRGGEPESAPATQPTTPETVRTEEHSHSDGTVHTHAYRGANHAHVYRNGAPQDSALAVAQEVRAEVPTETVRAETPAVPVTKETQPADKETRTEETRTEERIGARLSEESMVGIHAMRDNSLTSYRQACELCGCPQCMADLERTTYTHIDAATSGNQEPTAEHIDGNSQLHEMRTHLFAQQRILDALLARNQELQDTLLAQRRATEQTASSQSITDLQAQLTQRLSDLDLTLADLARRTTSEAEQGSQQRLAQADATRAAQTQVQAAIHIATRPIAQQLEALGTSVVRVKEVVERIEAQPLPGGPLGAGAVGAAMKTLPLQPYGNSGYGAAPSAADLSHLSEEERWKVVAEVARNSGDAQLQTAVAARMIAAQQFGPRR